jgi:hypothetical protein
MGIFLKREEVSPRVEGLLYGTYFASITIVYLIWHIPILNLMVSIIGLLGIASIYPESKTKKYLAVLFIYSMGIVLDVLVMSFLHGLLDAEQSQGIGNAVFSLLFFTVEWVIEKGIWTKERFPAFRRRTAMFILMPISSILMVIGLTTMASNEQIVLLGSIFVLFINLTTFYLYDRMSALYKQEIENKMLEEQMKSYRHELRLIARSNENIRQLRHDMRHHLLTLNQLAQNGQTKQIQEYLQEIKTFAQNPIEYVKTGNEAIDAILNYKVLEAKELGAKVTLDVQIPEGLRLNEFDSTVILGNMLQNAVEALEKVETKVLHIHIAYDKGVVFFCSKNTYKRLDTNQKQKEHSNPEGGLGLENIRRITKKYDGELSTTQEKGIFSVQVILYVD